MQKSLLAGLDLTDLNKNPVTPERGYPARQPEPPRPPESVRPEPMRQPDIASRAALPDANPLNRKKAGRPRLHADHVLTSTEKARRYRQKRKMVAQSALDGSLLSVEVALMGHRDLCLMVSKVLSRPDDLELRMNSAPVIKELKRRLNHL
jgi:hypothetical protein